MSGSLKMLGMMKSGFNFGVLPVLFGISILLVFQSSLVFAEVTAENFGLDETTIIEFTNNSGEPVNTFRLWLGSDYEFKSFKAQKGWVGEKTPQGVIVFSSSDSLDVGESVKFGIKTDKKSDGLNWKAVDSKNNQIGTGKALQKDLPQVNQNSQIKNKDPSLVDLVGINENSSFTIIPEKPTKGSTIRVIGENFGRLNDFALYIDDLKIGDVESDEQGKIISTVKIPSNIDSDRVDFRIVDSKSNVNKFSIRFSAEDNRVTENDQIKLTVSAIPEILYRGDTLMVAGTSSPNAPITAEVNLPDGTKIYSRIAEADSKGKWTLDEPVLIPLDAPFGKYSVTVSDGRQNILKTWNVETDKKIILESTAIKYDNGDKIIFSGTAVPNYAIELTLTDPKGNHVLSDIFMVDESGIVNFEYQTDNNSIKGTYTLTSIQNKHKEYNYVGLGVNPEIPTTLEFDKINYKSSETAIISLSGKSSDVVTLLIIDPSDKPKGDTQLITLQKDGTGKFELSLSGYGSGVYTAVISKGSTQTSEKFAVGLQMGSGTISISTIKTKFLAGESILVLGSTAKNTLLTLSLVDPNGNELKEIQTFTDKNGKVSEETLRIPLKAIPGKWIVRAESGSNYDTVEIDVLKSIEEGMSITISDGIQIVGMGKTIQIFIENAQNSVEITIISEDGTVIEELAFIASKEGVINQPWAIPKDLTPGTYTLKVKDSFSSAEAQFTVN